MIEQIKQRIEEVYEETVAIRRHLHMYPELSNEEQNTMTYISEYLTGLGIPNTTNVGGHGVVGIIGDPKAAFAVGIRADIDALPIAEQTGLPYASTVPGVMHACGHDIHTAILMGVAKVLKGMEDQLPGAVKLFFQPAEEKGGGARQMIADGCMQDPPVKRVLGLHTDVSCAYDHVLFYPHQLNAISTGLRITVRGRSSHGAKPDAGVDAILTAGHVLTALQSVVSRTVSPRKSAVVTVGTIQGGTKANIIADEVVMTGTIRTLDTETLDIIQKQIKQIVENTAACFGGQAETEIRMGYPAVMCDYDTTMVLKDLAEKALGPDSYTIKTEPGMGGEDFSYFANEVPSAYFRLGILGENGGRPQTLHNEFLCPDERCMKTGMLMEVLGTLALLKEEAEK